MTADVPALGIDRRARTSWQLRTPARTRLADLARAFLSLAFVSPRPASSPLPTLAVQEVRPFRGVERCRLGSRGRRDSQQERRVWPGSRR